MEENNYKRIIDNIEKENKYELKEGVLYRVKGQNKFKNKRKLLVEKYERRCRRICKNVLELCGINHRLSTPYRPQTNGLVERFNKTLCEGLAKLGEENWDKHIPSVLFAYRTKKQSSTRIKPFYAIYGRRAKLPLDKDENKITLADRVKILIEELPVIRRKIKENVEEAQEKQKQQHDKRGIRKPKFEIGEKVLLYEAWREKQWSGKLQNKWKGPYLIHEEFGNGAYKLKELDRRILKTPQNGEWLKKFYDRRGFTPKIVIKGKEVFDKTRVRFD
ncbi:KRAB-A domain-containing protein 2-like [Rhizophagus irregularis DAOM 181602=DAOM 197198]|nr:KRAB-A domain-containing protein 2-like [Rhizophagus irregularis DAOM 181602=DAOM 197198]